MKLSGYVTVMVGLSLSKPLAAAIWGFDLSADKLLSQFWQELCLLVVVYFNDRYFFKE